MKWKILSRTKSNQPADVVKAVLRNRGLTTKEEIEEFLNPVKPEQFTAKDLGLDRGEIKKALARIEQAIHQKEDILIYGDYDADGICATAILWESLYKLTRNVLPYIPERVSEGYGLNENSIKNLKLRTQNLKLIVTVDNGITAAEKIKFAKEQGIDVIVCDHHQLRETLPNCAAVVHTDRVCAAAIAWFLAKELTADCRLQTFANRKAVDARRETVEYLDLVAIASISDLEPLIGVNRSFVKYGLEALNQTKRCGLLAIMEEAGIQPGSIGTYEVGYIIGPRLNAMGRMEHALESLRLVCTGKFAQAKELAAKLGLTNKERQVLTEETARHAIESSKLNLSSDAQNSKLIFVSHQSYSQGVIGLVAGKLVEEFYRPAIVVSIGEIYSKASARSISGFNIIEAIRAHSDLLVDAGGHPMAAGFTVETAKVELLKQRLLAEAERQISEDVLQKTLKIDLELPFRGISMELWQALSNLRPFGLGNYEPVFKSQAVVKDFRVVGSTGKHLKLTLNESPIVHRSPITFSAIAFNQGAWMDKLKPGQEVEVAYGLTLNDWNGQKNLELKVKDLNVV